MYEQMGVIYWTKRNKSNSKPHLKKKKKTVLTPGLYDYYVESVVLSHFCLFGAGSSEGSVDN